MSVEGQTPELFSSILRGALQRQEYGVVAPEQQVIDGAQLVELSKFFWTEDGWFWEVFQQEDDRRLSGQLGELFPEFRLRQFNLSETLSGQIKAWHLHSEQDEIWLIPPRARMIIGVLDARRGSPTAGNLQRHVLKGIHVKPLAFYLPRGVAHGFSAVERVNLLYLVNKRFTGGDEYRLPYNFKTPPDFWRIPHG